MCTYKEGYVLYLLICFMKTLKFEIMITWTFR